MTPITPEQVASASTAVLERWADRGLLAAYLHGSVLTGRLRNDSDIDFGILAEEGEEWDWDDQATLASELEMAFHREVDLRMLRTMSIPFQYRVFEAGELIWERNAGEHERYRAIVEREYEREKPRIFKRWRQQLDELHSGASQTRGSGLSQ